MALAQSMRDINFRNFVEEHEVITKEDISGMVDFVLMDPANNALNNRNEKNSNHDVLFSEPMTNMEKIIENLMKPGAHGQLSCLLLQTGF